MAEPEQKRMREKGTREIAFVRPHPEKDENWVQAQFEKSTHIHSYGWYTYRRCDFEEIS